MIFKKFLFIVFFIILFEDASFLCSTWETFHPKCVKMKKKVQFYFFDFYSLFLHIK